MSFADIVCGLPTRHSRDPPPRLSHLSHRFHPRFSWPSSPDDIILKSSDLVSFYTSPHLLSAYSTFFADLFAIPTPTTPSSANDTHWFHMILRLRSASSAGLEIVLSAIQSGESFPFLSIPRERLNYGIIDAMNLSDIYDIPLFSTLSPNTIINGFKDFSFLQYALSACFGDESVARRASRDTLPFDIEKMPREAVELLLKRSPTHYARLLHLHQHIRPILLAFRQALALNVEIGGTMRFSDSCLTNRCQGVKMSKGDFHVLRRQVASTLWKMFAREGVEWKDEEVKSAAENMVGCSICGSRIGKAVLGAVEKHPMAVGLKDTI